MRRLFGCLLFLGVTPLLADAIEDVRCRETGFSQSVENGDMERFRSFLDQDARFVSASVLRGPDAITEAWSVFFAEGGPEIKWRPQFVEVLTDEKLALTRGPYRMRSVDESGLEREQWGTFNSVWRQHEDGVWRVVFDAGNSAEKAPDESVKALLEAPYSCEF